MTVLPLKFQELPSPYFRTGHDPFPLSMCYKKKKNMSELFKNIEPNRFRCDLPVAKNFSLKWKKKSQAYFKIKIC